ncbi:MAG: hypothetical protein IJR97_00750 [Clostridia bacterium]|nr:hypothetical protein [Clostridia bacterium]
MFRKIMITAFVAVALIATVTPAVMKANDIRQDLTKVIARTSDEAALNDTLTDDADHDTAPAEAHEKKALLNSASAGRNVNMDRTAGYRAHVTDLAMECGKALRGSNMFNSNVLGVLGGIVRDAMNEQ